MDAYRIGVLPGQRWFVEPESLLPQRQPTLKAILFFSSVLKTRPVLASAERRQKLGLTSSTERLEGLYNFFYVGLKVADGSHRDYAVNVARDRIPPINGAARSLIKYRSSVPA